MGGERGERVESSENKQASVIRVVSQHCNDQYSLCVGQSISVRHSSFDLLASSEPSCCVDTTRPAGCCIIDT